MNLSKKLSAFNIYCIAIGMVISGQYFGWNYGLEIGGVPAMLLGTGFVTIFYICLMFCFAELATSIPKSGGPSAFASKAFGPFIGYLAGIACLIEFIFAPPAIAVSIGSYMHFIIPAINPKIASVTAFIICILINLSGTKNLTAFETVVTLIALTGLIIYYYYGLHIIQTNHPTQYLSQSFANISSFQQIKINNIIKTIPFAIWLYLCVEGVAMTAEEIKNPKKNIPKSFIAAIITLAIFAFLTIVITALLTSYNINNNLNITDHPLPNALAFAYPNKTWLPILVDIFGLFGLFASLNGIIIGYSRQVYALSKDGFLPGFLSKLSTYTNAPYWALIIPGIFGIITTLSADLSNNLIILAVFGAVSLYLISLLSLIKLRRYQPNLKRDFKVYYPIIPIIALILGVVMFLAVFIYSIMPNNYLSGTIGAIFVWAIFYYFKNNPVTHIKRKYT